MKRLTVVQPFLFVAFPLLSLLASNIDFVRPGEIALPLALLCVVTALLLLAGVCALKDTAAAAITLSVFWFLFFSYPHLRTLVGRAGMVGEVALALACLALLALTVVFVVKRRGRLEPIAGIVTIAGLALVVMPLFSIAPALLASLSPPVRAGVAPGPTRSPTAAAPSSRPLALPQQTAPAASRTLTARPVPATPALAALPEQTAPAAMPTATPVVESPDIYYIILDAYARADVLADLYDYDESAFIDGLAARGFYVAGRSRTNYVQTYLSLGSSLNMTYLDEVAAQVGEESGDRGPLQSLLRDNAVAGLLKEKGYTYVTISTGYAEDELAGSADVFLSAGWSLSQFESGIINSTPLLPLIEMQHEMHRQRLLYAFEQLQAMPQREGPLFVLAHIAAPHPPFVFDANGERVTPNREFSFSDGSHYMDGGGTVEEYVQGYRGQLQFINSQVEATLDAILAGSPRPTVIVLQSDHGPGSHLNWYSAEDSNLRERVSILNAYYLPGRGALLYDTISPVNTFRLIMDDYFGAGYDLLPDRSYFATWDRPYRFIEVAAEGS